METNICIQGKIEKHTKDFYKNFSECKLCNRKRSLKCYF